MRIFIIVALLLCAVAGFSMLKTGTAAPPFRIMDGNKEWLSSDSLKGRIIVGFYEDRRAKNKNNNLKEFLNTFHARSRKFTNGKIFKLAVIDATEANIMTAWVWRKEFRAASLVRKVNVYGDWDGAMKNRYGFPVNESTFIIIDSKGTLAYVHSGLVPQDEFANIQTLIKKLLREAGR